MEAMDRETDALDGTEAELASLGRRLAARLLDVLVVFFMLLSLVTVQIFWFMGDLVERFNPEPWGEGYVPAITFTVMYLLMEVVFVPRGGQTPGKATMDVVVERTDGGPVSHSRAALRWLVPGVLIGMSVVPYPLFMIPAVLALGLTALAPSRQAIHDLMADTRVLHRVETEQEQDERAELEERIAKAKEDRSFMSRGRTSRFMPE